MATVAQTKATTEYIKNHTRRWVLQCNNATDSDIIEYLESSPNVNALLKELVRERIARDEM